MIKEYPIYVYSTYLGQSIMFVYKMSEGEMLHTKNGLYHYNYFEDACMDYIKTHYGFFKQALYKRERGMRTTMALRDIFFYNIFKSKENRIHHIDPIVCKYNKISDVYGNIPFNQLIHDRYFNIVSTVYDNLDMVCLQYFGTRAYTDEIAAANAIDPNIEITLGQVLKIPLHLEDALDKSTIKIFHGSNVLSFKTIADFKQAKIDHDSNKLSEFKDGVLIRVGKNESYVYYKGSYIRIINYF